MISRQWTGIAWTSEADNYVQHLREETFPRLAQIDGFRRASILRRDVSDGVEFLIITEWQSRDAIHAFAGDVIDVAVVPDKVQAMMVTFDRTARHYEVVHSTE